MLPEYTRLFHAINSLNEHNKPFQLQLLASVHGEGTSSIAAALATVATREIGSRVLLLDCNPVPDTASLLEPPVPFLLDEFRISGTIEAALQQPEAELGLRLARLSGKPDGILGASPAELQRLFDALHESFATVVLDCPPASTNPISLALSRYCDGTVLVVRAETTSRRTIADTKRAVERFGGQIVGVVFNRQRTYLPGWLSRRL